MPDSEYVFAYIYLSVSSTAVELFFFYTVPQAIASFPPRTTPPFRSTLPRSEASVSLLCHGVVSVLRGVCVVVGCVLLLM